MAQNRLTLDMQAQRVGEIEFRRLRDFPEFATDGGPPLLPGSAPAGATPPAPADATQSLEFTGEWAEYFKIWIVNVLLTIVTIGIYAAWAKVRKRRYFCANTRVFGHSFEYLADPKKILYGNMIVGGLFALFLASQAISIFLYFGVLAIFAVAVPWFIVRALAFNARNTAWRGLRFNFTGTYGEAAKVFILWPLLIGPTLGLILPLAAKKQKEFIVNRSAFGTTPFSFSGRTEDYYKIYGVTALFFLPLIVGYFAIFASIAIAAVKDGTPGDLSGFAGAGLFGILVAIGAPLAVAGIFYFRSRMFNYVWNSTTLAGNQFVAAMRARDLFTLHLVNSFVTLVTVGLMHPWAVVRTVKFQLASLHIVPAGNIDAFVAAAQPPVGAVGDAASDFFDFDLGFGL